MSVVSGVVLCCDWAERDYDAPHEDDPPAIQKINAWLAERGHRPLKRLDNHAGGEKLPEVYIYGGGFNHLDEDGFASFVMSLDWEMPQALMLYINPEDETPARVFRIGGDGSTWLGVRQP